MVVHAENFQVAPEALLPGTEVNGWRVRERLGAGGFGAAYQVESVLRPGEFYALKMARSLVDERTGREVALLLTRAVHPHVVRLHAFGRWPHPVTGYLYFIMDWVQGLALDTWAETHNPTVRSVVEKLAAVALTLENLHADGVLHRDLKPEHLLVRDTDGKPVLIDFGVGWYEGADNLTTQGLAPGTPHLRSPEAVAFWRKHGGRAGQRYAYSPADDQYALGVTSYRVLTGHWPFPPHLERKVLFGAIESLMPPAPSAVNPRVPRSVDEVILRMMAKRPQDRFPSCGAAHVALIGSLTFAGSPAVETELFKWKQGDAAEPRRVCLPEWPTDPKTATAPKLKQPDAPAQEAEKGQEAPAPAKALVPAPSAPRKEKRSWRRHLLAALAGALAVWGVVALTGLSPREWLGKSSVEPPPVQTQTHTTSGVGQKSSNLAGQKVDPGAEWAEPFWAAVPLREPTPAVVVSTTKLEETFPVKTQKKVEPTAAPQVPESAVERPARKGLEGARKALAGAAATCTLLSGCASLPPLPPSGGRCSDQAWKDMIKLRTGPFLARPLEYAKEDVDTIITVRESEQIVWTAPPHATRVPRGSSFIGRLWVRETGVYGRIHQIVTPSGDKYAVCLEMARQPPLTYDPETNLTTVGPFSPGANLAEPLTQQGVGKVRIGDLRFIPTRVWGELNGEWPMAD
ncbi:serine/threonine protein kinase [Hyalangium gracile]|uniref:serine/threonine protein kinase n=1 Tax=Hyalangium gracile TaxID=394092 RepID=UPI001CCD986D|nr:serine/threonine-protein kinase [Hyalangium gracile]